MNPAFLDRPQWTGTGTPEVILSFVTAVSVIVIIVSAVWSAVDSVVKARRARRHVGASAFAGADS